MGVPHGVLGSPHGINPCISLPHPITFLPNKPLVLKFLFQSASIDSNPRAQAGLRGSAPRPWFSITDLAVVSAQGMSVHSLSSRREPESWAQFLLQVTYPAGNLPPPGAPGRKKMPPESKLRCQHLRPGDPKGILGLFPLPSCSQLPPLTRAHVAAPSLRPGVTTRLPESAPSTPLCSWHKVSPPGINFQMYVDATINNFQIIFKMCLN